MFRKRIYVVVLYLLIVASMIGLGMPTVAQDDAKYNEAPMLAEMVANGELPPVEERLPENPVVLGPLEEIGTYGGTLRRGTAWLGSYLTENFTREPLTMWPLPLTNVGPPRPNLADAIEYNDEGTEVTVYLRKGVKWSDGQPFTAEDIEFYWYDVCLDESATESLPSILYVNGEAPTLEVIDEHTIKFIYPSPYYYFEEAMASILEIAWPKHYMSQFHPKYNEEATYDDLNANAELETGRGRVTLQAWMLDEWVEGEIYKLVRNPYYWKVDPEGNQLPYFDYATVEMVEDRQAVALGLVTGEFDLDAMWVGAQHLQLFTEAIEDGRDISLTTAQFQGMAMYFNLDHTDPVKYKIFRDINFRRAFSMALNRAEISDLFFSGLLTPGGATFSPVTPYFTQEDSQLWADYDPEAANALLDEAGYMDVDGDGFRETPDGEPLEIIVNVGVHDLYTPTVELITDTYLPDIGIKAIMNAKDQSLILDQYEIGEFDVHTWDFYGADFPLSGDLQHLAPAGPNTPYWHQNWEEDPISDDFLRYADILSGATTMPYEEREPLMVEASGLLADNVWIVNTGWLTRPFVKNNRLGNAPDEITRNSQVNDQPPWQAMLLFEKYAPGEGE